MAQGKAWDQDKVAEVLAPFLKLGYSVTKACKISGIRHQTVSEWLKNDEELRLKFESWQAMPDVKARQNVVAGLEQGSVDLSKFWLERREKEDFSLRQETTGADGGPVVICDAGENPYKTPEGQKLLPQQKAK